MFNTVFKCLTLPLFTAVIEADYFQTVGLLNLCQACLFHFLSAPCLIQDISKVNLWIPV